MKVSDLFEGADYTVKVWATGKTMFCGSFKSCVAWIKNYDESHKKYNDLRIYDPSGKEDTSWQTKPALQHKYKTPK